MLNKRFFYQEYTIEISGNVHKTILNYIVHWENLQFKLKLQSSGISVECVDTLHISNCITLFAHISHLLYKRPIPACSKGYG